MNQWDHPERKHAVFIVAISLLSGLVLSGDWLNTMTGGVSLSEALAAPAPRLRGGTRIDQAAPRYFVTSGTIQQADQLVDRYKLDAAEAIYKNALARNPRNAGALNGLGKIVYNRTASQSPTVQFHKDAYYSKAIQFYRDALRYQPHFVDAYLGLASVYMQVGRMGDAADEIARAMDTAPGNGRVLAKKGEWLSRSNRYNEALPYLKRAVEKDPSNPWAHYYLGQAFSNCNQNDLALDQLNVAGYQIPGSALPVYQRALILQKQGNQPAAIEAYRRTISLKPDFIPPRQAVADYLQARGDNSGALEQLKTIADLQKPTWAQVDRISKLSIASGQPNEAIQRYRQWMAEHPENTTSAELALSSIKTQLAQSRGTNPAISEQGESKRLADQAIHYNPNNYNARLIDVSMRNRILGPNVAPPDWQPGFVDASLQETQLESHQTFEAGEALLIRFQFRNAEDTFTHAWRAGDGSRSDVTYGNLFLEKGLPHLASIVFEEVLRRVPTSDAAALGLRKSREAETQSLSLVRLAEDVKHKKQRPTIKESCQQALALNIKNAEAHYLLAQTFEKEGNLPEAADHYYAYNQLEPLAIKRDRVNKKIEKLKTKMVQATIPSSLYANKQRVPRRNTPALVSDPASFQQIVPLDRNTWRQ